MSAVREAVRVAVEKLAYAIDQRRWDLLDQLLASGASIDETRLPGGRQWNRESFAEISRLRSHGRLASRHALVPGVILDAGPGRATAYTQFSAGFTDLTTDNADGLRQSTLGGLYVDTWVAGDGGWQLEHRQVFPANGDVFTGPFLGYRVGDFHGSRAQLDAFTEATAAADEPHAEPRVSSQSVSAADERNTLEETLHALDLFVAQGWTGLAADLVAADFSHVLPTGGEPVGREDYLRRASATHTAQAITTNPVISISADEAWVVAEFARREFSDTAEVPQRFVETRVAGVHHDRWRRVDGQWRLTFRREAVEADAIGSPDLDEGLAAAILATAADPPRPPEPAPLVAGPALSETAYVHRSAIRELHAVASGSIDFDAPELERWAFLPSTEMIGPTGGRTPGSELSDFHERLRFWRIAQQHRSHNADLWLEEDAGRGHLEFTTVTVLRTNEPHEVTYLRSHGVYADGYARTPGGWRVQSRAVLRTSSTLHTGQLTEQLRTELTGLRELLASLRPILAGFVPLVNNADLAEAAQ